MLNFHFTDSGYDFIISKFKKLGYLFEENIDFSIGYLYSFDKPEIISLTSNSEGENLLLISVNEEVNISTEQKYNQALKQFLSTIVVFKLSFLTEILNSYESVILNKIKATVLSNGKSIDMISLIGKTWNNDLQLLLVNQNSLQKISFTAWANTYVYEILKIFSEMINIVQSENAETNDVKKIKDLEYLIKANIYKSSYSIEQMAEMVNMSPTKFKTKFKKVFNQSAHQYILSIRAEQAKKLLDTKKFNMSQVAYRVGFNHPSGLTRLLKAHYAVNVIDF